MMVDGHVLAMLVSVIYLSLLIRKLAFATGIKSSETNVTFIQTSFLVQRNNICFTTKNSAKPIKQNLLDNRGLSLI